MTQSSEQEIVVEDVDAPAEDSPPITSNRSVDVAVSLMLLGLAALLGFDNWRTGVSWAPEGPEAGYFPFYLSIILALASLYGLLTAVLHRSRDSGTFVTRDQLRRVMQVLLPTVLFCLLIQWLGLYVASFLLIAGFMIFIGRIALWKSLAAAFLFSLLMFLTFEIAFDVIMPKGPLEAAFGF
jgi:putative tricarboxylic transport membrane protein